MNCIWFQTGIDDNFLPEIHQDTTLNYLHHYKIT